MDIEFLSWKIGIFAGVLAVFGSWFLCYLLRSYVVVNCWFCNCNSRVRPSDWNSWICSHCEQYNGFLPSGDYNRDLPQQRDESLNSTVVCRSGENHTFQSSNGLCTNCNRNQELKVALLASFQPVNPKTYDAEVEDFRHHLEERYPLCLMCEQVLRNVLSRKKSLILDMHLKMTGQKSRQRNHPATMDAVKIHLLLSAALAVTRLVALLFAVCATWQLAPYLYSTHTSQSVNKTTPPGQTNTSSNGISSTNSMTTFLALISNISLSSKPFVGFSSLKLENQIYKFFAMDPSYHLALLVPGATIQAILTWYSRRYVSLILWLLQIVLIYRPYTLDKNSPAFFGLLVVQVVLAWVIFGISIIGAHHRKVRPSTPVKRLSRSNRCSVNTPQRMKFQPNLRENEPVGIQQSAKIREDPCERVTPSSQAGLIKLDKLVQQTQSSPADRSVPLPLLTIAPAVEPFPTQMSSLVPSRPESVLSESQLSFSGLSEHTHSQDDARSDASIDSAISNPDSLALDAAESSISLSQLSNSYSVPTSEMKTGNMDVNNLIQGLNLGSCLSKQKKKTHEFEKRQYRTGPIKKPVLSPPKLVKTLNESSWGAGGFWQAHHGSNGVVVGNVSVKSFPNHTLNPLSRSSSQSSGFVSLSGHNQYSRPASPCSSVHSQDAERSCALSETSTPQNRTSAWGARANLPAISPLCIPAGPSDPVYRGSACGSPHFSQVIYTPYGFHQPHMSPLWNPTMFMMPPHASPSAFSESSSLLHNSQQSRSFNSSATSVKQLDNSVSDADALAKKTEEAKVAGMSRSFMESVWESRSAIVYTTVCYVFMGAAFWTFWHSNLIIDVLKNTFSLSQNVN